MWIYHRMLEVLGKKGCSRDPLWFSGLCTLEAADKGGMENDLLKMMEKKEYKCSYKDKIMKRINIY